MIRGFGNGGQAWGFDLAVASSIFLVGMIFFYFYALNYSSNGDDFSSLHDEGVLLASTLFSDGVPAGWNETNVTRIGIFSNGAVNSTKFERFYNLARTNYSLTRKLLGMQDNYYVNFSVAVMLSNGTSISFVGQPADSAKNAVPVTRIVPYNNSVVNVRIVTWN